jgi:hypothetical protein
MSEAMKQIQVPPGNMQKVLLIYDIVCQWIIHHQSRFQEAELLVLRDDLRIIPAVGKFHLGAHIIECFWKFTLNFIKGAGQVDGEVMERLWAELDKIAGFIRGMSAAHRQEVLDDMMIDSNWKKLVGIVDFLTAQLDRAQAGLKETKEAFDSLSSSIGSQWVEKWTKDEEAALAGGGIGNKIYEAAETKSKFSIITITIIMIIFIITIMLTSYRRKPCGSIITTYEERTSK